MWLTLGMARFPNNAHCYHPLIVHSIQPSTPFCNNINYDKGQTVKLLRKLSTCFEETNDIKQRYVNAKNLHDQAGYNSVSALSNRKFFDKHILPSDPPCTATGSK